MSPITVMSLAVGIPLVPLVVLLGSGMLTIVWGGFTRAATRRPFTGEPAMPGIPDPQLDFRSRTWR